MLDEQQLRCVECYGPLNSQLSCGQCGTKYERALTGAPILMTAVDRERYAVLLESERGAQMQTIYLRRRTPNWLRKLYPPEPVYVNPSAPPLPAARPGMHLWIGGAGLDLPGFVNLDVAVVPGVDVVANAARLPFLPASLDSIACLALLEHVPDPRRVVAEMFRVLKPGGEAQVVVPFCHPYHAYPADYSRFSRERLAGMFADFAKVEIGIRTGPTVTMLTFLTYYLKLILPVHGGSSIRRGINRLIVGAIGWVICPLKYLDIWLNRLPSADVLANHFYVVARR
jgi:SAM-dependent methyltransferase